MNPQKVQKSKTSETQTEIKCCCVQLARKFGIKGKFPCLNKIEEINSRSQTPVRKNFRPDSSLW